MHVLLDENVDRLLKPLFAPEFEVLTVRECGWNGMANGALLRAAEQEFDASVTMDRNLECQQNLGVLDLSDVLNQDYGRTTFLSTSSPARAWTS
jgi:hypothetical protein